MSGPTVNCTTRAWGTRARWPPRACPPGDRVLLAAPSVPEFVVAYLGIQAAGCVVVPVNTMSTRAEVDYVLGDAACSSAIAWHALGRAVAEAATELDIPFWTLTPGRVGHRRDPCRRRRPGP